MPVLYDDNLMAVLSDYDHHDFGERSLTGVGDISRSERQSKFDGTFVPIVVVELDGDETKLVDTLEPGFLPSECSTPPVE